jgi:hypothetical protein
MEWISVKVEKPKQSKDVLVVMQDETVLMARFVDGVYWKLYFSDVGLAYDESRGNK